LQVAAATRFVVCQFCGSSLEVRRTESAVFTQEVAEIAENTKRMAGRLEAIEIQNELERLDREWEEQKAALVWHGRAGGKKHSTNPLYGLGAAIFLAGAATGALVFGSQGVLTGGIRVTMAVMGFLAVCSLILLWSKAPKARAARESYRRRRAEVEGRLEAARKAEKK
jgi:hypothetical protein